MRFDIKLEFGGFNNWRFHYFNDDNFNWHYFRFGKMALRIERIS